MSVISDKKHRITFDSSAITATLQYLKKGNQQNLKHLISTPGSKLAYNHYLWSSNGPKLTAEEFWKEQLGKIANKDVIEQKISSIKRHLEAQSQTKWINEVLRYLPQGHIFNTTVYLIIGYDNIVFQENVALNLNNSQFHMDHREAIYYLIHELAHAGYLQYHGMPDLTGVKTWGELSSNIKFLTHLEGMGVISSLRLRTQEAGYLDDDYNIIRNDSEVSCRVHEYFEILSRFDDDPHHEVKHNETEVYNTMSKRPGRLWYITGCHMAQTIESKFGIGILRELVRRGSKDFFTLFMRS